MISPRKHILLWLVITTKQKICFLVILPFWDRVSVCSQTWPQTHDPPASTLWGLDYKHVLLHPVVILSFQNFLHVKQQLKLCVIHLGTIILGNVFRNSFLDFFPLYLCNNIFPALSPFFSSTNICWMWIL
jgi:hypothetical protein